MSDAVPCRVLVSRSAEATEELAARLGAALPAGAVVALDGELGTGKTTFVRGLARGLEVEDAVASPTFTLQHEYRGRLPLYHFDAWMEGRERAFLEDGGAEWFGAGGVAVVEWAARVAEWLPVPRIEIRLGHLSVEERRIELRVRRGGDQGLQRALEGVLRGLAPPPDVEDSRHEG